MRIVGLPEHALPDHALPDLGLPSEAVTDRSIEEALYAALTGDARIAALIDGNRVYPSAVPEGETPVKAGKSAITVQAISGSDEVSTDLLPGIHEDRFQITCWSETHAECLALFRAVTRLVGRLSGTYAGLTITETYVENRGDVAGLGLPDEQFEGYGKYLDVMVSY